MADSLTSEQVRQLRLRAQRLTAGTAGADVAQIVRDLCALQAQELPSAQLAIRARSSGLTIEDVRRAREVERSVVLTWTMRGTRHVVPAEDVDRQIGLFGHTFIHKSHRRYRQLGLDAETRLRATQQIATQLRDRGPLNRAELAQALAPRRIPVEGQAIAHLLRYAALRGVICFGPEVDGELTYVVLEDWLKATTQGYLNDDQKLAELARRYLQAYAPSTPEDLATWSGLTIGHARAGFEAISGELVEVETPSETAWMLSQQWDEIDAITPEHSVHLLPRYDNYLLGYRSRAFMVDDDFARQVHPGGGLIRSAVIVNGQAQAVWRMEKKRDSLMVIVQPFAQIDAQIMAGLEAEAQDIGRFLGQDAQLKIDGD